MKIAKNIFCVATILSALISCSSSKPIAETTITSTVERSVDGPLEQLQTEVVETEALIVSKDTANRTITVKDAEDVDYTFKVSPEVKRFNEIEKGDKIKISISSAVAFEVRPVTPEELANPAELAVGLAKNPANLPPGMVAGAASAIIVKIKAINLEKDTVTVEKPDGKNVIIKAKYPENLKRIKVGDTVVVAYIDAVAVEVVKQ